MTATRLPPPVCLICESQVKRVGEQRGYHFHRCGNCGLLFVWPLPDVTHDLYCQDYFTGATLGFGYSDYDRDKAPMAPAFEKYLDLLASFQPNLGRLLDVGAATGFFLEIARKRGWQVSGVEVSSFACELARQKGLELFVGPLERYPAEPETFEAVTLWDVVEHLSDPCSTLACAARLLKPGGVLALNTPDVGSLLARVLGLRWYQVHPPDHLVLFHQRSLRIWLAREGLEILTAARIGRRFTLRYVIQTLVARSGLPLWPRIADWAMKSRLCSLSVSLNPYDSIFLVARKPRQP